MASLFSLLDLGAATISAKSTGIAVTGNNTANADSEGYSRQRLDLRAMRGHPQVGGVRAGAVQRYESLLLSGRMRTGGAALAMSRAFTGALTGFELELTAAGSDVSTGLADFFASVGNVSASPLDPFARPAAVTAAAKLASSIRAQADAAGIAQSEADQRIRENAREASKLAARVAELNKEVQISPDPVVADMRDSAASALANLVGGRARHDSDGHMRVVLENGGVLVDGTRAASLEATTDTALGGLARLDLVDGNHRRDVTDVIGRGTIGGDLAFRDQTAPASIAEIDQLAFDFATTVNATHRAGTGSDGISGRDLFVEPTAVAGAAAALEIDPAIATNSDLLATGLVGGGASDNRGALALLDLRDQPLAAGGNRTFFDASIDLVAGVGHQASASRAEGERLEATQGHLEGLRDSLAGVSVQEELTHLAEFQRGVEAATRFVQTVDDLLGNLINNL